MKPIQQYRSYQILLSPPMSKNYNIFDEIFGLPCLVTI
jgi:hypothetical protein